MKKKIASLSILLCLLAVFFVIPVHAENTYVRELRNYSNSISSASLTYSVTAAQFGYVTESTLSGGMHSPILITARLTNNGTNDVKIANSYIDLTFTTYSQVSAYDCYTTDLMVQMVKNGNDTPRYNIVASNGYSYGGHIVVPAHSSLYLVFEVDIEASYNTSTSSVVSPSLDAVLLSINSADVVTGVYPTTGSIPEQLDEIDTLLTNLYSSQSAATSQLQNLYIDVHNLLTDIKNQITFTGTYNPPSMNTYGITSYDQPLSESSYFSEFLYRRVRYPAYLTEYDVETNGNNLIETGFKRIILDIYVKFTLKQSVTYNVFYINSPLSGSTAVARVIGLESNCISSAVARNNYIYFYTNGSTSTYSILPGGVNYVNLTLQIDIPIDAALTYADMPSTGQSIFTVTTIRPYSGYYPHSIEQGIADIYSEITSPSQQNTDTITNSNNAGTMSDQVHSQEEQWYRENDVAMENVGLSNYRYTQNQQNGIVGAVL